MAFTRKFTATRGKPALGDIVISAGSAEGARDVISVNIDADKMSKGEAVLLIQSLADAVQASAWPVS